MSVFSLPAEWAPQDAVMLTWPHQDTDWRDILPSVEPVFVEISRAISQVQALLIVCHNTAVQAHVLSVLTRANVNIDNIHTIISQTNDTWARDHGPITLTQGNEILALNFTFNGWGNKYPSEYDNQINAALFNELSLANHQVKAINFVLEGGAIESDGNGHLLTTAHCLFNQNRNPSYSKAQIIDFVLNALGLEKALVLNHGELVGDDTDAHIDTLCRFAPNNTLVYCQSSDKDDEHYASLSAMENELSALRDKNNQAFKLIPLPMPEAKFNQDGERLPATYANFLIINGAVLVPTYQDIHDALALKQMAKAFPEHEIIGIDCLPIIEQFGSLHCLTMQLPKGFLSR